MIDSTSNSSDLRQQEVAQGQIQGFRVARTWVKPTLERLSLKQALTGPPTVAEGATAGS
jgi:hypothetical protein